MNRFSRLPEFEKEFLKLSKKYRSLEEDLKKLERLITLNPVGVGTNFVTLHYSPDVRIVKTRLACKSLRARSMRVVYAYHQHITTFVHIEIYFKGDKENEDKERVADYIKRTNQ